MSPDHRPRNFQIALFTNFGVHRAFIRFAVETERNNKSTMSCFSCTTDAVAERDSVDDLKDQLLLLQGIFPDVAYPSIVNKDGMLVATLLSEEKLGIDLTATIAAIQSAAKHFSCIMGLSGCPHLQISGDTQIFSLYCLHADFTLVFFNNKNTLTDSFELGDVAARAEVQVIIQEINKVLVSELEPV